MPPVRILFIEANPQDNVPLTLGAERRNVKHQLWQSELEPTFTTETADAARIIDIPAALRKYRPHIVHFGCHGRHDGALYLTAGDDLHGELLAPDHLAALLRDYQAEAADPIRVILFAGCWTEPTARLAAEHVDCTVGFDGKVRDDALKDMFTPQFFAALRDGRSVPNALETARSLLRAKSPEGDADLLRICYRQGSDPAQLRPLSWSRVVLSDAHLDFLRMWFDKPWATVSLADILEQDGAEDRQVALLDVYVPLPVDFSIVLKTEQGRIVDWWAKTGADDEKLKVAGMEQALLQDEAAALRLERQRTWPALGVGEAGLQAIVDAIQVKIALSSEAAGKEQDEQPWRIKYGDYRITMEAHDAASVQQRSVLLGEPGSGKSSFLRHLALCLAGTLRRRAGDDGVPDNASLEALRDWLLDAYTPIYIELRELVSTAFPSLRTSRDRQLQLPEVDKHFWPYVGSLCDASLAAPGGDLRKLCEEGSAILLLDGLDEVPGGDTNDRRNQIKALVAALVRRYSKLRIIVAGRPHAYRKGEWALDGFGVAELQPLSLDRLAELAQALFPAVLPEDGSAQATSFIEAVESQLQDQRIETSFYKNPLFFTLLAGLWLDPHSGHHLPETRAELYRRSVDLLLTRWTRRRLPESFQSLDLGLNRAQLRMVMETLACRVQEKSVPGTDTTEFPYADVMDVLHDAQCYNHLVDATDYLAGRTGLLTSPTHKRFYFTHRSFQEHLAACELICPEPNVHLPPIAADGHFPNGLINRILDKPALWENVGRLAADELVFKKRYDDFGNFLVGLVTPYLDHQQCGAAAWLALEIAREQQLFPVSGNKRKIGPENFDLLRRAVLAILTDYEHFTPEQRNVAGELLGARPEHDTRKGVGLRVDGLPDIDWVEIAEVDNEGRREFIYQEGERRVEPTFWIARYPITYVQFQAFVDAKDGYADPRWWEGLGRLGRNEAASPPEQSFRFWNHPAENVSWYASVAFCRWLTHRLHQVPGALPEAVLQLPKWRVTLPTEWQWEKAARSYDGRRYPWGANEYQSGYANLDETKRKVGPYYLRKTSAVGMYPQGASPEWVHDLSGNVWEWCMKQYDTPEHIQESGTEQRVLRGGSWGSSYVDAAAVVRNWNYPNLRLGHFGFRVVLCGVPV